MTVQLVEIKQAVEVHPLIRLLGALDVHVDD